LTPNFLGYDNVTASSAASSGAIGARILPLSPTALAFGNVQTDSTSAAQVVTVTNTTAAALAFTTPTFCTNASGGCTNTGAPANYSQSNTCAASVVAGASCTISVTLTPSATGTRNAFMRVAGFGAGSVTLTATGMAHSDSVAPASLAFGTIARGSSSAAQTVTVTNNGVGPLTLAATPVTVASGNGANANNFREYTFTTSTCTANAVLPVGGTCRVSVTFSPLAAYGTGSKPATLNIFSNATAKTVSLTGTAR
jgi:hypothetical protein